MLEIHEEKITYKSNPKRYREAHKWIYENYGKATYCSNDKTHKAKRFEWANISGKYIMDIKDWKQLCPSCHRLLDYTEESKIKMSKIRKGRPSPHMRKVKQYTKTGEFIKEYKNMMLANKETGISNRSISQAVRGRIKTSGGYIWR